MPGNIIGILVKFSQYKPTLPPLPLRALLLLEVQTILAPQGIIMSMESWATMSTRLEELST